MMRFLIIPVFALFLTLYANAQRDTTKDLDAVDIVTRYNPVLNDARKVESQPELKEPETKDIKFTYTFPDLRYKVSPAFTPISAQQYRTKSESSEEGNFVKVGFGNYTTPLVHLELHNVKSSNYAYGLSFRHLSSKGKPEFKSFMDDNLSIHGAKYLNGNTISGKLGYTRNAYNFYGYNHEEHTFKRDSVRQVLNNVTANIHYDNSKTSFPLKTFFDGDINRFSTTTQNEIGYRLGNKTGAKLGNGDIYLNTAFEGFVSGPDSLKYNRNFVDINPVYKMRYMNVDLTLGANASIFLDSLETKFYLFPEFRIDYYLVPDKMKAFAGLGGGLVKGSTRALYTENQFLDGNQPLRNQITPYVIFAGIKGKLGSGFDYILELSQRSITDLPLFVNDTNALRKFKVLYDKVGLFKFQAGLNYSKGDKFIIGTNFSYYTYSTNTAHAYQRPDFEWDTKVGTTINKNLALHADLYVIGTRYAYNIGAFESIKQTPIADINIGADYRYTKYLTIFANLNNLTNQTYQRWFNYPSYGFNGVAGVTFVF